MGVPRAQEPLRGLTPDPLGGPGGRRPRDGSPRSSPAGRGAPRPHAGGGLSKSQSGPSFPAPGPFSAPDKLTDRAKDLDFMRKQNIERNRPGSTPDQRSPNLVGALLHGSLSKPGSSPAGLQADAMTNFGQRAAGGSHTSHGPVRLTPSSLPRVSSGLSAIPSKKEIRRREQQGEIHTLADDSLSRVGTAGSGKRPQ